MAKVFTDNECSRPCKSEVNPMSVTFSTLRENAPKDSIWYKIDGEGDHCHKMTFSGLGFHLGHEDKFHECAAESSTIMACMVGETSANIRQQSVKNGAESVAFYQAAKRK